ncbi:FAD-dependent oxidoreductase [Leptolyngbya sp. 15MV]|nr:FAD-dependent oxidoreductase [Leptolyngbya sp. 15MV]
MADRMLQFVRLDQRMPDKRAADARRADFGEIYQAFDPEAAKAQSSRCSQCGVPFCQVHCPLNNNIPDWLKLTAEGRLEEAYEVASATNTFPEICGRICPQDRLCEGNCVIEKGFGSVTIGSVEKYITDTAWERGWVQPPKPIRELRESVGIIGAGPAGLAAAERLRVRGYQVHVYDRYDRVGGLMIYGIPNFKLEKEVVLRRAHQFEQGGIHFHLNTQVGRDISLAALRAKHDAVLIGTGVYKAREMAAPGIGLDGIVPALEFLTASNRKGLGESVAAFDSGALNAAGKNVVVIGGGDTAMDCVRGLIRQQAPEEIHRDQLAPQPLRQALRAALHIREARPVVIPAHDPPRRQPRRPGVQVLRQHRIGVHRVLIVEVHRHRPFHEVARAVAAQRPDVRAIRRVALELLEPVGDAEPRLHRAHTLILLPRIDAMHGDGGIDALCPGPAGCAEQRAHLHHRATLRHEPGHNFDRAELELRNLAWDREVVRH